MFGSGVVGSAVVVVMGSMLVVVVGSAVVVVMAVVVVVGFGDVVVVVMSVVVVVTNVVVVVWMLGDELGCIVGDGVVGESDGALVGAPQSGGESRAGQNSQMNFLRCSHEASFQPRSPRGLSARSLLLDVPKAMHFS